jgi:hypothetical protein
LIAQANVFLQKEATKPQVKTAPMKAKVRQKEARIAKLVRQVEEIDNEALTQGFSRRIVELQKEVNQLHADIRAAEARNQASVKPLDMEHGRAYLANIHNLLSQEIPVAAEAIRSLTGPIKIRQEPIPGLKRRARWIATFSPNLLGILRIVAGNGNTASLLAGGNAVPVQPVEVVIEKVPQYERLAAEFKRLHDKGASINTIATAHGLHWQAAAILHFAETGERPKFHCGKRTGTGPGTPCRFKEIAEKVVHLRDQKKMSFARIAAPLRVSGQTVRRAYDHAHPEIVRQAAERGQDPCRGRYSHLGQEKYDRIQQLLDKGKKPAEVAAQIGCGTSTVNWVLAQKKRQT